VKYLLILALFAQTRAYSGSIEGHVFNSLTGLPVHKATVVLDASSSPIHLLAETNSEGVFQFTGLPSGNYRLKANRSGFLERRASQRVALGQDEHLSGKDIRIPPQGVISGRILDADGDPLDAASVRIHKQVYRDGRRSLQALNVGATSNDTGEYRISNLSPGRYFLQAIHQKPIANNHFGDADAPKMIYVPTFYPNAISAEKGLPVEVNVGTVITGVDIQIVKLRQPALLRVSGKVVGVDASSQAVVSVAMYDADRLLSTSTRQPDQGFEFKAPPGQYTMTAELQSGGAEAYASSTLDVNADTSNVVLALSPAPQISGKITVAEGAARIALENLALTLRHHSIGFARYETRPDSAGAFAKAVRPGRYSLEAAIPDGCFWQNLSIGGVEASMRDFQIQNPTRLEMRLNCTAGKTIANVLDSDGRPAPDSVVCLVPLEEKGISQKQIASDDGTVHFKSLRPGKYKLYAWDHIDDDLWQDPDFLKNYASQALEITVGPSETKTPRLTLIRTE
jgi:hypothetical protein